MDWILKNIVQIATVVFVIVSIVRAMRQAKETQERHKDETIESEEQRRTREIQERIRRKIAERRGGGEAPADPFHPAEETRTLRPSPESTSPPPDPFGELGRRVLAELERKMQPSAEPPRLAPQLNRAELERQARLAEELRAAEEARAQAARRAAHHAAERAAAEQSEAALRHTARARLLGELHDPQSVRRAFVLREVLGTPVGLR